MAENYNDDKIVMSRFAFEKMQSKDERNDHWKNIALIWAFVIILILIILLVGSNALWLHYWNQYEYVEGYVEIDTGEGGDANYIGNDGDISYGTNSSSQENENTP